MADASLTFTIENAANREAAWGAAVGVTHEYFGAAEHTLREVGATATRSVTRNMDGTELVATTRFDVEFSATIVRADEETDGEH